MYIITPVRNPVFSSIIYLFFSVCFFRFITFVICSSGFCIAWNIVHCLWLHSKRENERIACWIIAGTEQKRYSFTHAHSENTILSFYDFFLSLSTINKRNMNSISRESEPQFLPIKIVVWKNKCMNVSCWSGLLNWLWNGFLNNVVSSRFSGKKQKRTTQMKTPYNLYTHLGVKGPELWCNVDANASCQACNTTFLSFLFCPSLKCSNGLRFQKIKKNVLSHYLNFVMHFTTYTESCTLKGYSESVVMLWHYCFTKISAL